MADLALRWVNKRPGYWAGHTTDGRLGGEIRATASTHGGPSRWRWTAYRANGKVIEGKDSLPGHMAAKRAAESAR